MDNLQNDLEKCNKKKEDKGRQKEKKNEKNIKRKGRKLYTSY